MIMTNKEAYEQLTKLQLEIIEAQVKENEERYKEQNDYLVAIERAKGLLLKILLSEGMIKILIVKYVQKKTLRK